MNSRTKSLLVLAHCLACAARGVESKPESSIITQSTPAINASVCSFRGLPSWVLEGAEAEAARIFGQAGIRMKWLDCDAEEGSSASGPARGSTGLVIRFVPHALPPASATAMAMAFPSAGGGGFAFIFYDRVAAEQTSTSLLQTMLGRVAAHEITHLLVPEEEHSRSGLMRGHWNQDDLRFTSEISETLPPRLVRLLRKRASPPASPAKRAEHFASLLPAPGAPGY